MASSFSFSLLPFFFLSLIISFLSHSNAQLPSSSSRPHGVVLSVTKDASSLQYLTHIFQRTPKIRVSLTVDLGGQFTWVDCEDGYKSSSYRSARCKSVQCKLAGRPTSGCLDECYGTPRPGCSNHTCSVYPYNSVSGWQSPGDVGSDSLTVKSTDGSDVMVRGLVFSCAPTSLVAGLAGGAKGIVGLGRSATGLSSQFSLAFRFPRKFAMCLSSSKGAIIFGDGPYMAHPGMDLSTSFTYTPLIVNPVSATTGGEKSPEYYIGVKSIKVGGRKILLKRGTLSLKKDGLGGTKISTVTPYTVMETSIYNAVTSAYIKHAKAMNISRVASVSPFGVCFSTTNIVNTRAGAVVPSIDLVLQNKRAVWRIFGSNSMVKVKNSVSCLGFVDGGSEAKTSIVIGGYQLEDNLLQFDIPRSRLGFTSSLLFGSRQVACSAFNN